MIPDLPTPAHPAVMLLPLAVLLAFLVVERRLQARWSPGYWRRGIIIYRRDAPTRATTLTDHSVRALAREMDVGPACARPFRFHRMGPDIVAVRSHVGGTTAGYAAMRGLLALDPAHRRAEAIGLLNWSELLLGPALALSAFGLFGTAVSAMAGLLLGCLLLGVSYLIQTGDYRRVLRVACTEWDALDGA